MEMTDLKFGKKTKELMTIQLAEDLKSKPNLVLANFERLSVTKTEELRKHLKGFSANFRVVKNAIAKRALNKAGLDILKDSITGSCGIGLAGEEPVPAIRSMVNFAKENETFEIYGGYIEGQMVSLNEIKRLASLPSRPELLSQVLMGMKSPLYGFVNVLSGTLRGFMNVVEQLKEKKGGQ